MEIRAVKASEIDETLDLQCQVFRPGQRGAFERYGTYVKEDPTYTLAHTRVVFDHGRLVAHLRIWDRTLCIRGAEISAAGIGSLLVHPDYRGRGYAHALMADSERFFFDAGYDIGLLFTIIGTPFYEVQGWTSILLPEFKVRVEAHMAGTVDGVRVLHPHRDLTAVEAVYAEDGVGYCGVATRASDYWLSGPSRIRSVFPKLGVERDGELVAYVNFRGDENGVWVNEACARPGAEDAFDWLARAVCADGRTPGQIAGSLPQAHSFVRSLETAVGQSVTWRTDDHMMLKLVNWETLAAKLGQDAPAVPGNEWDCWRALYGVADSEDAQICAWM